jgi:aminobenzoyl-glutamate utilization protein B
MLGSAALLAATAVKNYLAARGIKGRVRYYGCPAEEGGAAKVFMVRAGHFDDVDIAITWHPAAINRVDDAMSLANTRLDFTFKGRASHAAAAPHLGRSALDAVELMNVGVNYMREHMPSDARIHYAMLDAGGVAPNVVQATAKVRYAVRARELPGMRALVERVRKVAAGAAMMTETQVDAKVVSAVSNLLGNTPLEQAMQRQMEHLGLPPFDAADRRYAAEIQGTLTPPATLPTLPRPRQRGCARWVSADQICGCSLRPRARATWWHGSVAPARANRCCSLPISTSSRRAARTGRWIRSSSLSAMVICTGAAPATTSTWPRRSWPT